jgi:hypothetical protein
MDRRLSDAEREAFDDLVLDLRIDGVGTIARWRVTVASTAWVVSLLALVATVRSTPVAFACFCMLAVTTGALVDLGRHWRMLAPRQSLDLRLRRLVVRASVDAAPHAWDPEYVASLRTA